MDHLAGGALRAEHRVAGVVQDRVAVGVGLRHAGLAEVLGDHDVGRELRPTGRDFRVHHFEHDRAIGVGDAGGAFGPLHAREGIESFRGVVAPDRHAMSGSRLVSCAALLVLDHTCPLIVGHERNRHGAAALHCRVHRVIGCIGAPVVKESTDLAAVWMAGGHLAHPFKSRRAAPIARSIAIRAGASVRVRHRGLPDTRNVGADSPEVHKSCLQAMTMPLHPVLQLWGHATGGVARYIVHPPLTTTQYVPQGHVRAQPYWTNFAQNRNYFRTAVLLVRSQYHQTVPVCRKLTDYRIDSNR